MQDHLLTYQTLPRDSGRKNITRNYVSTGVPPSPDESIIADDLHRTFCYDKTKATGRGFMFVMYWLFLQHMGMLRTFGRVGRDVLYGSSALC